MTDLRLALVVPTLNAGSSWERWIDSYRRQDLQADTVLVLDSMSDDDTARLAEGAGFRVVKLDRSEFNHGTTRQKGVELVPKADILCFMTQDALFADGSGLSSLVGAFQDTAVGAAYGRQVPRSGAGFLESFPRLFNYPPHSMVKSLANVPELGIKTAFLSNSFAAYRRTALERVSGFPNHTVLGEDAYAGAKMILAGWKIAYCAKAVVYHSHDYTIRQEFRRYFDIGVFHHRESWMLHAFGKPGNEGVRYLRAELAFLAKNDPSLIPHAMFRSAAKLVGYRAGRIEAHVPIPLKRRMSMHPGYWR